MNTGAHRLFKHDLSESMVNLFPVWNEIFPINEKKSHSFLRNTGFPCVDYYVTPYSKWCINQNVIPSIKQNFDLVLIENTVNSNENAVETAFRINRGKPVFIFHLLQKDTLQN